MWFRFWRLMHRFYMQNCLNFAAKVARRAICRWCAARSVGIMEWFKWLLCFVINDRLALIHAGLPGPGPLHSRGGGRITGQSLRKGSWVSRSVCSLNLNQSLSESLLQSGTGSTRFGYYVTKGCSVEEDTELRIPNVQKHHNIMLTGMAWQPPTCRL